MKLSISELKDRLSKIQETLDRDTLLPLSSEKREELNREAFGLFERIDAIDHDYLTIGLLGGTGVGKSTLMNALTKAPISSVSHRRPHTDHVIVYRHEKAGPLEIPPDTTLPLREVVHGVDSARHLLLCDLPDFDSLIAGHREGVLEFLSRLDLLIWVTSPEKYADSRFYEFLSLTPKARSNFLFVLNKCDELFEGNPQETGYARLDTLSRSLTKHLKSAGIDSPTLLAVSSLEALNSDSLEPWNSFPILSKLVFQQRDMKAIREIKAENLDVEAERLFGEIQKCLRDLEQIEKTLDELIVECQEEQEAWIQAGRDILSSWLQSEAVLNQLKAREQDPPLVGPGRLIYSIISALKHGRSSPESAKTGLVIEPPEHVKTGLKRRLEGIEDRLHQKILAKNLPKAFVERFQESIQAETKFNQLGDRFFDLLSNGIPEKKFRGAWAFKLVQRLIYLLLLLLLILALGDFSAWRELTRSPSGASFFSLLVSIIQNLFSPKGLAALGSFTLLNLFFSIRFYMGFQKRLKRLSSETLKTVSLKLSGTWEKTIEDLLGGISRIRNTIFQRFENIRNFTNKR